MRLQFFSIPAHGDAAGTDALNSFLARHRICAVRRRFVDCGTQSYWAICVSYVEQEPRAATALAGKGGRVDYREVLSPADFAIYARLREVRKELAARDGVPPYHVLTNEQLADLVQRRVDTRAGLEALPGFGTARLGKYGDQLVAALKGAFAHAATLVAARSAGGRSSTDAADARAH
jgi:superfamily II DNA helicase RecQ